MKNLVMCLLIASTSISFAADATDINANWTCTTNASSSDSDKAIDDKMANSQDSVIKSFTFAAQNCRDCTKITCEIKK